MSREVWVLEKNGVPEATSFAPPALGDDWLERGRVVRYVPADERELVRTRWEVRWPEGYSRVGEDREEALSHLRYARVTIHDAKLVEVRAAGGAVVCAWGAQSWAASRGAWVYSMLDGCERLCLGMTRDGHPRHPLYVPYTRSLTSFELRRAA